MTTHLTMRLAAAAALSVLLPAHAHHSYGMFDQCNATSLDGEIESIQWVNPHIVIYLRTQDVARYRVEWYSLAQLEREGIPTETLNAGDRVRITGHAMRDPDFKVLSLLSAIEGPSGWTWAQRNRPQPASCAG